jgi:polysaccharide pyruvyl transferase WcaK-like protein
MTLKNNFEKVYLWIQGSRDYEYAKRVISSDSVEYLSPSLFSLDSILKSRESIEYIGTRLHAGIRALQHSRRAIIIGVDNRAKEKAKDFNLPVVMREQIDELQNLIQGSLKIDIDIPQENIERWKNQF